MVYKNTSSDVVIAKVFRDFKPSNSGWVFDAFEWIGEGLNIMGAYTAYERKPICIDIVDYKGKLPCTLEQLEGVEYDGYRLPYSSATNSVANCCTNLPVHSSEYCSFNPNYIQTSFATGKVILYCLVLPTDCNGLPMVPDNTLCTTALAWYIITMMLLRGFKHQVITYPMAVANWEKFYPQAKNSMNYPDIERYDRFRKSWTSMVGSIDKQSTFFNTYLGSPNTITETGNI